MKWFKSFNLNFLLYIVIYYNVEDFVYYYFIIEKIIGIYFYIFILISRKLRVLNNKKFNFV